MKTLRYLLVMIPVALLLSSCLKEYSFEGNQVSSGSLLADASSNCSPDSVYGTYLIGKKLNDSNFIQVQAHVTHAGAYTISTDTSNGFSFSSSGNFSDTGTISVKLLGKGTPAITGSNVFRIFFNSSVCSAVVSVADSSNIAAYTLQGAPNACTNYSVMGSFIKGITLDTSAKVIVALDVARAGSYTISTNTVNGYTFSGSGFLSGTGTQEVILTATGTPANAGTDAFIVTAGNSTCSFSVTVLTPIVATTDPDHFPLTMN